MKMGMKLILFMAFVFVIFGFPPNHSQSVFSLYLRCPVSLTLFAYLLLVPVVAFSSCFTDTDFSWV